MEGDVPGPQVGPTPSEHPDPMGRRAAEPGRADKPPLAVVGPARVAEDEPPTHRGRLRRLLYVSLPGCWGALVLGCLSFTPSLLPRGGVLQGVVWGITAAIGYGLGVLAAWIWRGFADREPRRPRRRSWLVFFISARINTLSVTTARWLFFIYAALVGVSLSTLFHIYTNSSITRVFFITAAMFGALSLFLFPGRSRRGKRLQKCTGKNT